MALCAVAHGAVVSTTEHAKSAQADDTSERSIIFADDFPCHVMSGVSASSDRILQDNLPPKIARFQHQVAGHGFKFGQKVIKDDLYVLLACDDGSVLKPVRSKQKCRQEVAFYQQVFSATCDQQANIVALRKFIPKYLGLWLMPGVPEVPFLRISDATHGFKHPCVADIKVGPLTYSPGATLQKIMKKQAKYPPKEVLGFRIMGFRVYKPKTNTYEVYTDTYGLSLGVNDVLQKGFGKFFTKEGDFRRQELMDIQDKLQEIYNWFENQRHFMFRSSSILLIYEGCHGYHCNVPMATRNSKQHIESHAPNMCSQSDRYFTRVKMIDFEHVYNVCERDDNYLCGLKSVMSHLTNLMLDDVAMVTHPQCQTHASLTNT